MQKINVLSFLSIPLWQSAGIVTLTWFPWAYAILLIDFSKQSTTVRPYGGVLEGNPLLFDCLVIYIMVYTFMVSSFCNGAVRMWTRIALMCKTF